MNVMDLFSLHGKIAIVTGGAECHGKQLAEGFADDSLVRKVVKRTSRIDVLINNAVTRSACSGWKK